jgi:hypothetical protein
VLAAGTPEAIRAGCGAASLEAAFVRLIGGVETD